MSGLGTARWYLDADTLGLAHILARARPGVTSPGDDASGTYRTRGPDIDRIPVVSAAGLAVLMRDNRS